MAEPPAKSPSPADGFPVQASGPSPLPVVTDPPHDVIEAEDAPSEDDGYESDLYSTTSTSISSSVRDYAFENSRRYHKFKEGRYHFPNDEPEQEREDMRHAMLVHLCGGKLHYSPLENPQKILDVGTGTGIWAVDMADEYPDAEVIGVDLSPIQPAWVPPNVRFLVDDAEATWLHQPNSLDYVHLRNMAPAVKDWPKLMDQAFRALKPGGWIEIQDLNWKYTCDDGTMPADYALVQMTTNVCKGLEAFGIQLYAAEKNAERLAAAGFVDIRHKMDKVPVGTWPKAKKMKTIGLYNRSSICDGLHGITMGPLTRGLKWSPEEVEVFLVKVRKDLMNSSIHSYVYFHTFCGQKPLDS